MNMISILYFMISMMLFTTSKCFYRKRNLNAEGDELQNNLETFVRPIKKLTDIFPHHEIQVQFDIERNYQTQASRRHFNNKYQPHEIIRRNNISRVRRKNVSTPPSISNTMPPNTKISESASDQDNQIVYMKDLKKALDDFEKKHNIIEYCNHGTPPNQMDFSTIGKTNGPLYDIINSIKNSGKIHNAKPNDEELSWLKIKFPA